jgi:hypothetical protein
MRLIIDMHNDNVREYDEIYTDRLCGELEPLADDICKGVKEQILEDIIQYVPDEDDSMDQLFVKKIHMEEDVFPKLFNFKIKCEEYDNVYIDICKRLDCFIVAQKEMEEYKEVKTQKELDREKRLKYYMK